MFDRIARVYDLMNAVMTVGMHSAWRAARGGPRRARARRSARSTWRRAPATWRSSSPARRPTGQVVGMDFSEEMLELARGKAPGLEFEAGNALELPYADGAFDAATVGFGARNFADLDRGLREMARVVRPGRPGRRAGDHDAAAPAAVVVLPALVRPRRARPRPAGGRFRRLHVSAQLGAAFPRPGGARRASWRRPGSTDVRWILTAGGIIAIHCGTVPTQP